MISLSVSFVRFFLVIRHDAARIRLVSESSKANYSLNLRSTKEGRPGQVVQRFEVLPDQPKVSLALKPRETIERK
jgi:hypothetical protein